MLRLTQFDDNESKFGGTIVSEWKRMNQNSEDSNILHQSAPFGNQEMNPQIFQAQLVTLKEYFNQKIVLHFLQ